MECSEHLRAEIDTYCFLVRTRCKPAAALAVQQRFIASAIQHVAFFDTGLQVYTEELADGWVTLWIYKFSHILEVIKSLPQAPETSFDHWVLGKLFGYSEDSIAEYLADFSK